MLLRKFELETDFLYKLYNNQKISMTALNPYFSNDNFQENIIIPANSIMLGEIMCFYYPHKALNQLIFLIICLRKILKINRKIYGYMIFNSAKKNLSSQIKNIIQSIKNSFDCLIVTLFFKKRRIFLSKYFWLWIESGRIN